MTKKTVNEIKNLTIKHLRKELSKKVKTMFVVPEKENEVSGNRRVILESDVLSLLKEYELS